MGLLENAFQPRQLHPVIHTVHFPTFVGLQGFHVQAGLRRHGDQVGEIVFTLGIIAGKFWQAFFQKTARARQNAGIDFLNAQLGFAGIFLFHNALHIVLPITDDAAVAIGIIQGQRH